MPKYSTWPQRRLRPRRKLLQVVVCYILKVSAHRSVVLTVQILIVLSFLARKKLERLCMMSTDLLCWHDQLLAWCKRVLLLLDAVEIMLLMNLLSSATLHPLHATTNRRLYWWSLVMFDTHLVLLGMILMMRLSLHYKLANCNLWFLGSQCLRLRHDWTRVGWRDIDYKLSFWSLA